MARKPDRFPIYLLVAAIIFSALALWSSLSQNKECKAQGGVLMRGAVEYVCVKDPSIILQPIKSNGQ